MSSKANLERRITPLLVFSYWHMETPPRTSEQLHPKCSPASSKSQNILTCMLVHRPRKPLCLLLVHTNREMIPRYVITVNDVLPVTGEIKQIKNISALARDTPMVKHALDSSLDKLCGDALTVQISSAESPLA